jgi:hypothetical protein
MPGPIRPVPAPKASNPTAVGPAVQATVALVAPAATDSPAVGEPAALEPSEAPTPVVRKRAPSRLTDPGFQAPEESIFTARTYIIAAIAIGVGIGYLVWQRRQRQLELEASAVSRTPFSPAPTASGGGAMFPPDLLANLEWKRFEELVEAYYSKTGVVAARTKTGPASPVHVKISWKGESRPFACVQCIAHPRGLIEITPIQELFAVLTAEDIRRGYVVTTGRFSVPARDFAEEKHITLLSGDLFLEKVNALPPSARNELVQEFSVGDYTTPTCPTCDAKMVQSEEDPKVWKCKVHPEVTIPAWK